LEHKGKGKGVFFKKTRVTLRKVRKDTHITVDDQINKTASITPYSMNDAKYPLIYPPFGIPGPGKLIQTKENPC
jgi:hypothetical protein